MRVNGNIKRLVLHFRLINLLHKKFNFTASFGEKLSYKFSLLLELLLFREIIYKLNYYIGLNFI